MVASPDGIQAAADALAHGVNASGAPCAAWSTRSAIPKTQTHALL